MPHHATRPTRRQLRPCGDARGFTLVELLVVMLILGILALVALPAFFNQREKGQDSEAKLMLRTATTAIHTFQIDHGTFAADPALLTALEPSLAEARDLAMSGTPSSYELAASSATGNRFTVTRDAAGVITHTCTTHGTGLCRSAADANGNWW